MASKVDTTFLSCKLQINAKFSAFMKMSFRGKKRSYPYNNHAASNPGSSSFSKKPKAANGKHSEWKGNNKPKKKKTYTYIMELKDDCWYVGTTIDPTSRLDAHRSGKEAEWTRQHPPMEGCSYNLKEVKGDEEQARLDEDSEVKRLMKEHGIEKVRGGSYSTTTLSRLDVKALSKELRHASGGCLRCGHKSHWATSCFAKKDVAGNAISDDELEDLKKPKSSNHYSKDMLPSPSKYKQHNKTAINTSNEETCHRCGRIGHWVKDCFAKLDIEGYVISSPSKDNPKSINHSPIKASKSINEDFCRRCGRKGHWTKDCYAKTGTNGLSVDSPTKDQFQNPTAKNDDKKNGKEIKCFRCGRNSHVSTTCNAKTHLNGHEI